MLNREIYNNIVLFFENKYKNKYSDEEKEINYKLLKDFPDDLFKKIALDITKEHVYNRILPNVGDFHKRYNELIELEKNMFRLKIKNIIIDIVDTCNDIYSSVVCKDRIINTAINLLGGINYLCKLPPQTLENILTFDLKTVVDYINANPELIKKDYFVRIAPHNFVGSIYKIKGLEDYQFKNLEIEQQLKELENGQGE